jgi:serine protease AprX
VDVPAGYSKYVVVFNDTCDIAECTAMIEDYCSRGNCQVVYKYNIIKAVAIVAPDSSVAQIMDMGDIKYIEKAQPVQIMLNSSVPLIGADQARASGYTGNGIRVAIVDTGVDAGHPDLSGKVVAWTDLVGGRSSPYDDHGHGTHVSSIIAGSGSASGGKYKGVAPGASLMVAKVLDASGSGDSSTIMAGVDWAARHGAQVISLSLGSYQHLQAFDDTVNNAVKAGVVVVVAAGNGGPSSSTISCPGDSPNVITVGATDKGDNLASFSSRGPAEGKVKPDVVNVGVGVIAARASDTSMGSPVNQYYTSASAPAWPPR